MAGMQDIMVTVPLERYEKLVAIEARVKALIGYMDSHTYSDYKEERLILGIDDARKEAEQDV